MEIDLNSCRLCFIKEDDLIDIHSKKGAALEIPSILSKHFVFLAIEFIKSPINSERKICKTCWTKTFDFHLFYSSIFNLQQNWLKSYKSSTISDTSPLQSTSSLIKCEWPDVDVLLTEKLEIVDTKEFDGIDHHSIGEESNDDLCGGGVHHSESIESDKPLKRKPPPKKKRKRKVKRDDSDSDDNDWNNQFNNSNDSETGRQRKKPTIPENGSSSQSVFTIDVFMKEHKFLCEICQTPLETFAAAKEHYRTKHQQKGYIVCCGVKYCRRDRANYHVKRHGGVGKSSLFDVYICDICQKTFTRRQYIKRHIETHIQINEKSSEKSLKFKCTTCDSSFASQTKLNKHISAKHKEDDNAYTCPICGKKFMNQYVLKSHVKNVHENASAQMCDTCGRVFKCKQTLQEHYMDQHSDIVLPKIQCELCGIWLKHKNSLRIHMIHHNDMPRVCPVCQKSCPNKKALNRHMQTVHVEKTHQCTICEKAFKTAIALKEHIACHTGESLYTCPYCPHSFKSCSNMHSHRKRNHPVEWLQDREKRGIRSHRNPPLLNKPNQWY